MQPIYLDYNATTPIIKEVADELISILSNKNLFGNPSSGHIFGRQAHQLVETARERVASMLECDTEEIIFTSGGSESNNLALKGLAWMHRATGGHIITSSIEHPAISCVCDHLGRQGFQITTLPVDSSGVVSVTDFESAIRKDTVLISIMHANNEIGSIQPIAEISRIARTKGVPIHTDAAQSVGKIPTSVKDLGVDLLSIAGHKFYGPKGVGALYIRKGTQLSKQIHGADHERGIRAGTENLIGLAGIGKAAQIVLRDFRQAKENMIRTRDRLKYGLETKIPGIIFHGDPSSQLPNTLSAGFPNTEANKLVDRLSETVAVSAGAACHSGEISISKVLTAIGVPDKIAIGTIRFSTGRSTTKEDVDKAVTEIVRAYSELI